MFKKTIFAAVAAATLAFAGTAGAQTWVDNTTNGGFADSDAFNQAFDPKPAGKVTAPTLPQAELGSIELGAADKYKVSFTFLGKEAGFKDEIFIDMGNGTMSNKDTVGTTIWAYGQTGSSLLDFTFLDQKGNTTSNGDVFGNLPLISWGWLKGATSVYGTYDFIIGLNDSAGGVTRDYDDMVLGITITAVPEPESLALMLAGLGCVAVVGRRRKQA